MASENVVNAEQNKPVEEKIAELSLQEAGLGAKEGPENLDGGKEASDSSRDQVVKEVGKVAEKSCDASNEGEQKPVHDCTSREVEVAHKELQKSPDEEAHVTPSVESRSIIQPGGEEKTVEVPTAVVHENADSCDKQQEQGKGLIHSVTGKITNSVKSVFSGFGGSKTGKNSEAKVNEIPK